MQVQNHWNQRRGGAWGTAVAVFLAASLALAACSQAGAQPGGTRPRVVATFTVIGDLVGQVGGEAIELVTLAGPGVDTHTFTPTAADGAALAEAQVVFEIGLGFDGWLDGLYASTGSQARRVALAEGLALIEGEEEAEHDDATAEAHEHEAGTADPHVWHDVSRAIAMVRAIGAALAEADPNRAATYRANAEAYEAELQALDEWIQAQVATLPPERRKLVTTHDTFAYYAQRYGFEVVGTLLPTSTEGAAPSAQALARLVEAVRAAGVPAVFAENVSSNALLNQVATEAGVRVVATLHTDALGPPGSDAETYTDMMRANTTTIVTALNPPNGTGRLEMRWQR